ncbi:MFS general substrate transporter [Neofusicoccum parvum]|nr:MFS general substrate transporter [Neofusicoccum parvum]
MDAVRSTTTSPSTFAASRVPSTTDTSFGQPDFADPDLFPALELFCPIAADDIRNRWLNSYIPVPGQQVKEYPASITAFIYRILKSYAAVAPATFYVPDLSPHMRNAAAGQ